MLRQLEIDKLAGRFGYQDLEVSLELGIPGDPIKAPEEWVQKSIPYLQQFAHDLSISREIAETNCLIEPINQFFQKGEIPIVDLRSVVAPGNW